MCELCGFKSIKTLEVGEELELAPAAYFAVYPEFFDSTNTEWMYKQVQNKSFIHNTGNYHLSHYCELCGRKLDYIEWVKELWCSLTDIPMNPKTECIEKDWECFKAGTNREEIWHWFEETFNVSVAEDLISQ